jgi:hypothetical protein
VRHGQACPRPRPTGLAGMIYTVLSFVLSMTCQVTAHCNVCDCRNLPQCVIEAISGLLLLPTRCRNSFSSSILTECTHTAVDRLWQWQCVNIQPVRDCIARLVQPGRSHHKVGQVGQIISARK